MRTQAIPFICPFICATYEWTYGWNGGLKMLIETWSCSYRHGDSKGVHIDVEMFIEILFI
jgi:hypothetical protein